MRPGSKHASLCTNCGAVLHGRYCDQCGQKRFDKKELTVASFLEEALHSLTHFDSKIFKAILYLFTRPGFLTREFSEGRVNKYIRPLTLFLLLNAFFIFFIHEVFPFRDADYTYYMQQDPSYKQKFEHYGQPHHLTEKETEQKFNSIIDFYKKISYFIIIPLFALGLQVIFTGRKKLYLEFLVQSIHTYCWYVLTIIILIPLIVIIAEKTRSRNEHFENMLLVILFIVAFVYNYFAIKKIFSFKTWLSLLYALPVTILMIFLDGEFSGWLNFQLTSLHFRFSS